jgi:hypothetical protein
MDSNEKKLAALQEPIDRSELDLAMLKLSAMAYDERNAKKLKKLDNWRTVWGGFMLFIVLPAWFCAGVVEGETLSDAAGLIFDALVGWFYLPNFLAVIFMWPITILAKLIPASSTWPFVMFLVLGAGFIGIPILVFSTFFGCRFPPYFREMKSKVDPLWEIKENEGVIVHASVRSGPFSSLIVFFVLSGLVGCFLIMPSIRTVIADRWVGKLYVVEPSGRKIQLDAKIQLNFIDPGYIVDLRPGVKQRTLFFEFSGTDVALLKKLGIKEEFFQGANRDVGYSYRGCAIAKGSLSRDIYEFKLEDPGSYYGDEKEQRCPKIVRFRVSDFSNAELAVGLPGDKYYLASDLHRDSRWSIIEQGMVGSDFHKNPDKLLARGMGVR